MFNSDRELVENVVSLRTRLNLTESSLQAVSEQLSRSKNEIVAEHRDEGNLDGFSAYLSLEDLQKCGARKAWSYPEHVERCSTPKHIVDECDCTPRSTRDMAKEADQLRRKLSSIRENRQLISDLETAQLEFASSKSKLCVLGSSIGAKSSSVSAMKEQLLDLEAQVEAYVKALREAELRRVVSEQSAILGNRLVEELRDELAAVKSELSENTHQWKRTEQQRNQALINAEKLSVAFKNYKVEIAEKLKKVLNNEGKLKASLIECDSEKEELDTRCTELEKDKERMNQNLRELKEARDHIESLSAERLEQLRQMQMELERKEVQLEEVAVLKREREDLRLLTACQEQRLSQAYEKAEQSQAELNSLESVLDILHLRQNQDGALCVNPCLLPLSFTTCTGNVQHKAGDRYQKLLVVLQSLEKEKARQVSAAQSLQERLNRAHEEISTLQTSINQKASHYQQLHNQLLEKAAQSTTLEKELKKKNSRIIVLQKQLQEKSSAYSQAAIKTSHLEQQLMEKDSSIEHYQSVLKKKQKEHQQDMESSRNSELNKCKKLEDRVELLQLSLVQSQAEGAEMKHTVLSLQSEKQEAQQQTCLLQESIVQLTQELELRSEHSEAAIRLCKEQAKDFAAKVKLLETELSGSRKELNDCLLQIKKAEQKYEEQLELKNSEMLVLQEAVRSRALACESSSTENMQLQHSMQRQQDMLQDSTARIAHLEENQCHLQNQVSQLEQDLEKERSSLLQQLRSKEKELDEVKKEMKTKEEQAVKLSGSVTTLSSEMSACREELTNMEQELLKLRRDSNAKAAQLGQMESSLQETKGLLDRKSEMVLDLEEKLHRSEMDRRNSMQQTQFLEEQLNTVRGELADTRGHLEELRNVLQRTQLTADQHQMTIKQLTVELRESRRELEERNHEVLDMDTVLKERQGELQQRAQLLGQLDVAIKEHKLEMERKVEHLQDVVEKTETKLKDRDRQVVFLTEKLNVVRSQLQGKEELNMNALEHEQQLHVCHEQLQKTILDLQEAYTRCETLSKQLDDVTEIKRRKESEVQLLQEQRCAVEKRGTQIEAQHQASITALQNELEQQREEHHRELSALQRTRGQLLKVLDQISTSLRSSQEQLEEAKANAANLHLNLQSTDQLLQHANETLIIKESEITRLQAKISSLERASELQGTSLQHDSGTVATLPPLKVLCSPYLSSHDDLAPSHCNLSSTSWEEASSDVSLMLSENPMVAVKPQSNSGSDWEGLSLPDQSCTSDMTFNPLTYVVDGEEPDELELDSLSGMLKFVNQTLALQEHHSFCNSNTTTQATTNSGS